MNQFENVFRPRLLRCHQNLMNANRAIRIKNVSQASVFVKSVFRGVLDIQVLLLNVFRLPVLLRQRNKTSASPVKRGMTVREDLSAVAGDVFFLLKTHLTCVLFQAQSHLQLPC